MAPTGGWLLYPSWIVPDGQAQTVPIQAWACVLMLHKIGSPSDTVYMEYLGRANDPGSPCATAGLGGGSVGPMVPVLVQ